MPVTSHKVSIAVVGSGPAGMIAALALAGRGHEVALVGPLPTAEMLAADTRTAALFVPSIALVENLGLWPQLRPPSAPIAGIRLIDDTGSLFRAPQTLFHAREVGFEAFGYNVVNAVLVECLMRRIGGKMLVVDRTAAGAEIDGGEVTIRIDGGGEIRCRLAVAADGRNSVTRAAAGIAVTRFDYPQSALAVSFSHPAPHEGISTEFHRPNGPLTTVPLPGLRSSLVWVERREEVARLAAIEPDAFLGALDRRLMGLLGRPAEIGRRATFPLASLRAERFGARRVALVSEAAHVVPPIGAQGLNLGLRDIAHLVDCIDRHATGGDPGASTVLDAYDSARQTDVVSRVVAVDLLNRSLFSGSWPFSIARGLGLHAINLIGPLRDRLVREGLGLAGPLPALMRR